MPKGTFWGGVLRSEPFHLPLAHTEVHSACRGAGAGGWGGGEATSPPLHETLMGTWLLPPPTQTQSQPTGMAGSEPAQPPGHPSLLLSTRASHPRQCQQRAWTAPTPPLLLALLLPSRAPAAPLSPELSSACQLTHPQRLFVPGRPSLSALDGHLSQLRKEKGTEDTSSFHHIYWGQACTRCWGLPGGHDRNLP